MNIALATAFAALTLAGSAFADTRVVATLDASQPARNGLIAASASWTCAGTTCVTQIAPDEAFSVDGCKAIAKQLGHVVSYTGDLKSLDAKALAKCNTAAAAASPVGTASR